MGNMTACWPRRTSSRGKSTFKVETRKMIKKKNGNLLSVKYSFRLLFTFLCDKLFILKLPINHHKINNLSQSKVKSTRKEYFTESKFPFFFLIIFLVSTLNVDFPLELVLLGQQAVIFPM